MLRIRLALCLLAISLIKARDVPSVDLQKQNISISVDTTICLR